MLSGLQKEKEKRRRKGEIGWQKEEGRPFSPGMWMPGLPCKNKPERK